MEERFGDVAGPQAHRGSTARLNGGFKEVRMAGWGRKSRRQFSTPPPAALADYAKPAIMESSRGGCG